MRIRVFHNTDPLAMARRYDDKDEVVEVHTYDDTEATYPAGACDTAFYLFNVGDDQEYGIPDQRAIDYRLWRNRSLTVGDIVAGDDEFYACDSRGWTKIAPPTIVTRSQPGTTPLERVALTAAPAFSVNPGRSSSTSSTLGQAKGAWSRLAPGVPIRSERVVAGMHLARTRGRTAALLRWVV